MININGFLTLIRKYKEGTLSNEREEVMERWYEAIGGGTEDIVEDEGSKERVWEGVVAKTGDNNASETRWLGGKGRWLSSAYFKAGVAAAILMLLGYYYFIYQNQRWLQVENRTGIAKAFYMEDGSRVVLAPGSIFRFPSRFDTDKRTVRMEKGNIFFDVAKNAAKPFLVYTNDVVVSVLGTSFRVKDSGGTSSTEITVSSGKVGVDKVEDERKQSDGALDDHRVVLTPNRKVTFDKRTDEFRLGIVDNPLLIKELSGIQQPKRFDFESIELSEIIHELENAYGIPIYVRNQVLKQCRLTADLSSDDFFGKIEVLNAILGTELQVTGDSVALVGGTCRRY